ncbi:hypothetical protein RCL06_24090, partial [Salmonella enterica subsp. enterica serovar Typhimurium]
YTRLKEEERVQRRVILALLLFALYFALVMGRGAKQQERYILTTFLLLDGVAAWGWWTLMRFLWAKRAPARALAVGLAAMLLGIQIGSAVAEY